MKDKSKHKQRKSTAERVLLYNEDFLREYASSPRKLQSQIDLTDPIDNNSRHTRLIKSTAVKEDTKESPPAKQSNGWHNLFGLMTNTTPEQSDRTPQRSMVRSIVSTPHDGITFRAPKVPEGIARSSNLMQSDWQWNSLAPGLGRQGF